MYKYLDVTSYYRNRRLYPNPSMFSLDIYDKNTNSLNAVCPVIDEHPFYEGVIENVNDLGREFPIGSWLQTVERWHQFTTNSKVNPPLSQTEVGMSYKVYLFKEDSYKGYLLQDVFKNRSYTEIELVFLKLPSTFKNSSTRVFYIELVPRTMNKTDLLFSNNRNAKNALFKVLLDKGSSIARGYGSQIFDYAENNDFMFRVIDEYGELLNIEDNEIPLAPKKEKQISALFRLKLK